MSERNHDTLDDDQLRAVVASSGPIVLRGGAGTGKTHALIHRIVDLIQNRGVGPGTIFVVTTTERAAQETRDRLTCMLPESADPEQVMVGTFYSLSLHLLNVYQAGRVPEIVDRTEATRLIRRVMLETGTLGSAEKMSDIVSLAKVSSSDRVALFDNQTVGDVFEAYQKCLVKYGAMDVDDVLLHICWLLQASPDTLRKLQDRFCHVLVDAFQDVNPIQYELIRILAGSGNGLFVAADPDQTIFESQGSALDLCDRVVSDFDSVEVIRLTQQFRSTPEIVVGAAESAGLPPITSVRPPGLRLRHLVVENPVREGMAIAREIRRIVGGKASGSGTREVGAVYGLGDIGVLFRTERQADVIERCLEQDGIPVRVSGQSAFLDTVASRNCLNFLKFVNRPTPLGLVTALDSGCFGEGVYLTDGIDDRLLLSDIRTAVAEIPSLQRAFDQFALAALTESPRTMLEMWSDGFGGEGDFDKLFGIADLSTDFEDFLCRSTRVPGRTVERRGTSFRTGDAVSLMTIHAARDRVFPVVFVCGVEEGLIPMEREDGNLEEERRLLYVAMTRAKDELILSNTRSRSVNGLSIFPRASRFLDDVSDLAREEVAGTGRKEKVEKKQQLTLF